LAHEPVRCAFDYEAFAAKGGMVGHGGVLVFDDSVDLGQTGAFAFHFCAIESCGKCNAPAASARSGARRTLDKIMRAKRVVENIDAVRIFAEPCATALFVLLAGLPPCR